MLKIFSSGCCGTFKVYNSHELKLCVLCVCMCMGVRVCYVYVCAWVCVCVMCMYVHGRACVFMCMYVHGCACVLCVCMCMYVRVCYVYVCVCTCVCVHVLVCQWVTTNLAWLEDMALRLISVLVLDRFGDYISDEVSWLHCRACICRLPAD